MTDRRLTFVYRAPGEAAARTLANHLTWETTYDVQVLGPGEETGAWRVAGATKPTDADEAAVEEWVDWLVEAGAGLDCELERWQG
jgi:hypothetical protein